MGQIGLWPYSLSTVLFQVLHHVSSKTLDLTSITHGSCKELELRPLSLYDEIHEALTFRFTSTILDQNTVDHRVCSMGYFNEHNLDLNIYEYVVMLDYTFVLYRVSRPISNSVSSCLS